MKFAAAFERFIVPGLVIQAVIVGAGYATGRELVEFFVSQGPVNGLIGMGVTALAFGVIAMISFELARQARAFDYQSFCRIYLRQFAAVFEVGYIATLLLTLSVVAAGAGTLLGTRFGWPQTLRWTGQGALLDLALNAGLDVPYICRSGDCQSCALRLICGEVAYPEDLEVLAPEGYVLMCQATPACDVEIEL